MHEPWDDSLTANDQPSARKCSQGPRGSHERALHYWRRRRHHSRVPIPRGSFESVTDRVDSGPFRLTPADYLRTGEVVAMSHLIAPNAAQRISPLDQLPPSGGPMLHGRVSPHWKASAHRLAFTPVNREERSEEAWRTAPMASRPKKRAGNASRR